MCSRVSWVQNRKDRNPLSHHPTALWRARVRCLKTGLFSTAAVTQKSANACVGGTKNERATTVFKCVCPWTRFGNESTHSTTVPRLSRGWVVSYTLFRGWFVCDWTRHNYYYLFPEPQPYLRLFLKIQNEIIIIIIDRSFILSLIFFVLFGLNHDSVKNDLRK